MYYYIAEPVTTQNEKNKIDEIKALLSQLGIAGEFALASPARTVEEHLELAFRRGFTTIVGIGSDTLINRVASTILTHNYDGAALGAIPLSEQQVLWQLTGHATIRQTCEALRARQLIAIDALRIKPKHSYITDINLHCPKSVRFHMEYDNLELFGSCTDLAAKTNGQVRLWDGQSAELATPSFWRRLFHPAKTSLDKTTSLFTLDHWSFATEEPCPIFVGEQEVTTTPLAVNRRPKALKLIVNHARITTEKESQP